MNTKLFCCGLSPGNPSPEEEDARRIAEMGKPILGEHRRLEVVIEENCNFKVCGGQTGAIRGIQKTRFAPGILYFENARAL